LLDCAFSVDVTIAFVTTAAAVAAVAAAAALFHSLHNVYIYIYIFNNLVHNFPEESVPLGGSDERPVYEYFLHRTL
jgi:hypothetical protein